MIPSRFLFVPWMPMTTSGKVDRQAIRTAAEADPSVLVDPSQAEPSGASGAPRGRPLNYTEGAIARVWQRLLGVASVAHDDHFFSIGGDSLTAVQMMMEIESRFGLVLPAHLAFEAPTLEALAARIERAREQLDDDLGSEFVFPLVSSGVGVPLFFNSVELSLARRGVWALGCPLFAIANWAKGSGFVQAKSLEALASQHIAAVRRIQPHGPYRLAGYSLGGLIAFEMAQQLRGSGQEVEFLFLLDPMAPGNIRMPAPAGSAPAAIPTSGSRDPLHQRIVRHLQQIAAGPGDMDVGRWIRLMLLSHRLPNVVEWLHYLAVNHYLRHPNVVWRLLFPRDRWRAFWFAAQRIVGGYAARPYDGPVLAVFCRQGPRGVVWSSLLPHDACRYELDAPHHSLFEEPALGRWTAWLSDYMGAPREARR